MLADEFLTLLDKNKSHIGIYQYDSTDRYKTRFSNENTENRNHFKLLKQDKQANRIREPNEKANRHPTHNYFIGHTSIIV